MELTLRFSATAKKKFEVTEHLVNIRRRLRV
jgi:hypothetical protein